MTQRLQCPHCSKKFTVSQDLTGKTVECGACNQQFKVALDTMVTEKDRFYPGENKDDFLDRIGRAAPTQAASAAPMASAQPAKSAPKVDAIMPSSPGQSMAVGVGLTMLIFYALVFFLGTEDDGVFKDIGMFQRLALGGFVGALGGGLIFFGARRWRVQAFFLVVLLLGGLFAMIWLRPVEVTPVFDEDSLVEDRRELFEENRGEEVGSIREKVGYESVSEKAKEYIELHGAEAGREYVSGVYITNCDEVKTVIIGRYLKRVLNLSKEITPFYYRRNRDQDRLVVIAGVVVEFDTLVEACEKIGKASSYPEDRIVLLDPDPKLFQKLGGEKREQLINPADPAFFDLNLAELSNIEMERVKRAVSRLAAVPEDVEKRYRARIIPALLNLMESRKDLDLLRDVGLALDTWGEASEGNLARVSKQVREWVENEHSVAEPYLDYLISGGSPEAADLVNRLWQESPSKWGEQFEDLGSSAEDLVIDHLENPLPKLRREAARLLARIGSDKSLPALRQGLGSDDADFRRAVEQAITSIERR